MKTVQKRKRRPPALIHFPQPRAAPEPGQKRSPAPREGIIEHLIVLRTPTREEKWIDPREWAPSGLERIPLSDVPFRVTVRGVIAKLARVIRTEWRRW